ncbi:MAG: response regulator [Halorhabdus sp.]
MSDGDEITVLCVDDDSDILSLTETVLQRKDDRFEILTETDPTAVTERLSSTPVDCVVSDYDMPHMDGIELLETIRADHPTLPFILFTGKGSEEVASEAIARGVTDYLQKGTGLERYALLSNRIANAVTQRRARQQAIDLDRIRGIVREVNQTLVRATDRETIEQTVCEIITGTEPYRMAWIGQFTDDEHFEIRASARDDGGVCPETVTVPVDSDGSQPLRVAIQSDRIETNRHVDTADSWIGQTMAVSGEGYASSAVIPLRYHDSQYGALRLFASVEDAFTDREKALLAEIGDDVAHSIYRTELSDRQRRYEQIIENLPVGVYRNTSLPEGTIIEANPAFADLLGADSPAALLGRSFGDRFVTADERDAFVRQLQEEGSVRNVELELETLRGESFWASVTGIKTRGQSGEFFDGIVQDVTEQRRRNRELQRYEQLFDVAPVGIFRTGSDGTVYEVNEAMANLVGYDTPAGAVDAYNDLAQDLYSTPGRRETFIQRLATEGTVTNFGYDAVTKSGDRRTFQMNATVLDDPDDRPFEIVGYTWRVPQSEIE